MHMQSLSTMSSDTAADPNYSGVGVKEWNGWPKAHTSAVVIIPPECCWPQIQDIRSKHDRAYKRWMPHINLLYPFIVDDADGKAFTAAENSMTAVLARAAPFQVRLSAESFRVFRHGKNCTLWLKPELEMATKSDVTESSLDDYENTHEAVMSLQKLLEETFPSCNDLSNIGDRGFTPHLSVGQFRPRDVQSFVSRVREDWTDVEFQVSDVALISRSGRDDPFVVRTTVPLANSL